MDVWQQSATGFAVVRPLRLGTRRMATLACEWPQQDFPVAARSAMLQILVVGTGGIAWWLHVQLETPRNNETHRGWHSVKR